MDILAANDQENRVRAFQAGAAGKPVNNGSLKPFAAKTPGPRAPKTPFKVPLNDENATFRTGKPGMKMIGKGNAISLEKNAFVTPAGPRTTRAPLGMKTTNAKTKAFQTPAPLSASAKTQKLSPRLRRPKVKVHQAEPAQDEQQEEEREIEYMPPREVPLPDDFDDLPSDWKFPMFEGKNLTRGIGSAYFNPIGDDGLTKWQREEQEALARDKKKSDEEMERIFADINAKEEAEIRKSFGIDLPREKLSETTTAKPRSGPSTLKSRSAAAALSPPQKPSYLASTTTTATKPRVPSAPLFRKTPKPAPINPSASRHATAISASKSTIGYGQSRNTSTSRKPLSNLINPAPSAPTVKRPTTAASTTSRRPTSQSGPRIPSVRTPFSRSSSTSTAATLIPSSVDQPQQQTNRTEEDVERELRLLALANEEDDEDVDAWMEGFMEQNNGGALEMDEELEGFQFVVPE
jgi:hypothetical protein